MGLLLCPGDWRNPGSAHVDGVAVTQRQRLGVPAGDLSDERRTIGGAGHFDADLEPQVDDPVDRCPDDTGALRGAVAGGDRHLRGAPHANVVRANQDSVQRRNRAEKGHDERIARTVVDLGG